MFKIISTLIAFVSVTAILWTYGYRYNATESLEPGIYRIAHRKALKGDYAWFCPPNNQAVNEAKKRGYIVSGSCPGNYIPFMKMVAATEGDTVTINSNGVYVNGALLKYSKPLSSDANNRPLTIYKLTNYRMEKDEYLMMTDYNSKSFDARYFGIVKSTNINKLEKVITWKT
jgi:conjugative transfer signal peptidase TraF